MKVIKVEELDSTIRIDKYLHSRYKNLSRHQIAQAIKNQQVLVNLHKVKPSFSLKGGEKIYLQEEFFRIREEIKLAPLPLNPEPQILYQDKHLLALNKPAGVVVHPNAKNIKVPSIASWLILKYPFLKKVGENFLRPGIVHRLDKDTSGVLLIAKDNPTFFYLKNLFKNHQIKKEYLALVWGRVNKKQGEIQLALTRSPKSPFRRKVVLSATQSSSVKPALTKFQVIKKSDNFTLLKVFPRTGRTHQIRVHLAAIGFPVVGDKEYGPKTKKLPFSLQRQFLHCIRIAFFNSEGSYLEVEAPLPADLQNVLHHLHFD